MLYITTSPVSLVSYHAMRQNNAVPQVYRKVDSLGLNDILVLGSPIKPALVVIDAKSDKPPKEIMQSPFNTAYLCVSGAKYWEALIKEKDWIQQVTISPELYKKEFDSMPAIFADRDARDNFWERFKNYPEKLHMELTRLFFRRISTGEGVSEDYLDAFYGGNTPDTFLSFKRHIGTKKGTAILKAMPATSIWTLLIGTEKKPAYIYYYLVGKNGTDGACPELYHYLTHLQSVVNEGVMDLKIAAVLFHDWVVSVGVKKSNKQLEFAPTIDELTKLNNLLN